MDKLIEYVCDELEQLEKKADKGGKLSMQEIQYADMLAHLKKNILTGEAMMEDGEYSNESGGSYARGGRGRGSYARRDSMGRYSRDNGGAYVQGDRGGSYRNYSRESGYSRDDAKEDMIMQLREMEQDADEESRRMIKKWIKQVEEQ